MDSERKLLIVHILDQIRYPDLSLNIGVGKIAPKSECILRVFLLPIVANFLFSLVMLFIVSLQCVVYPFIPRQSFPDADKLLL